MCVITWSKPKVSYVFRCISCLFQCHKYHLMHYHAYSFFFGIFYDCLEFFRMQSLCWMYSVSEFSKHIIKSLYSFAVRFFMCSINTRHFQPEKFFSHSLIGFNHKIFDYSLCFSSVPSSQVFNFFIFIKNNLNFRKFKIYASSLVFYLSDNFWKFEHCKTHFFYAFILSCYFFISLKNFIYIIICHTINCFDYRFICICWNNFSFRSYFHITGKSKFFLIGIKRTYSVWNLFWKHRQNSVHKINWISSSQCLFIKFRSLFYIMTYIRNTHYKSVISIWKFFCIYRIIKILCIGSVNCNYRQMSKVFSSFSLIFCYLCLNISCFFQCFSRKNFCKPCSFYKCFYHNITVQRISQFFYYLPFRFSCFISPKINFYQNKLPVLCHFQKFSRNIYILSERVSRYNKTKIISLMKNSHNCIIFSFYYSFNCSFFFSASEIGLCYSYKNSISVKSSIEISSGNKYSLCFSIHKSKFIFYHWKHAFYHSCIFRSIVSSLFIFYKLTRFNPRINYYSVIFFIFRRPV